MTECSDTSNISCHLIHDIPDYIEKTAQLINQEWPKGLSTRLISLRSSKDEFPCNLILVDKTIEVPIAHCRLSTVSDEPDGLLIETVVVDKSLRGQGFGKLIMNEAEKITKLKGKTTLFLSTHDKRDFYAHIGYIECDPVTSLGANSSKLSTTQLQGLLGAFGGKGTQANDQRIWMKKILE